MRLVIDASVAIKWVVDEPDSDQARTIRRFDLIAPDLLFAECANALWKAATRGSLPSAAARAKIDLQTKLPLDVVPAAGLVSRALEIAISLRHPVYDALYLATAEGLGTRVVTADNRLLNRVANTPFAALAISLQDAAAN